MAVVASVAKIGDKGIGIPACRSGPWLFSCFAQLLIVCGCGCTPDFTVHTGREDGVCQPLGVQAHRGDGLLCMLASFRVSRRVHVSRRKLWTRTQSSKMARPVLPCCNPHPFPCKPILLYFTRLLGYHFTLSLHQLYLSVHLP